MAFKTASPDRYELLKEFARENRRNATLAETVLWEHIRENALGVKFLRQHIIGDYIVDFLSRKGNLIIEVDGGYHAERKQMEEDRWREDNLTQMGYHILRFSNEEILYDINHVIQKIKNDLRQNEII
ncbi:MAG: endonuclease domain-containing protein [Bacteroidaceae bacterium]|nr:endonuclease domain-containing protein [Bacteroidaceae bacterium]